MGQKRRHYTCEQKASILREHLVEQTSVADLCDKHGLKPTACYRWQKEVLEQLPALFARGGGRGEAKALRAQVEALEAKLARKDAIIAQIMEEYVAVKKTVGGI